MTNVVQMQLITSLTDADGAPSGAGHVLDVLDFFFTVVFALELGLSMFAHWFHDFWHEGWNWWPPSPRLRPPLAPRRNDAP